MRNRVLFGGGGLTLAAGIVLVLALALPGRESAAAAAAVRLAASRLADAEAVRMSIEYQSVDDPAAAPEHQTLLISAAHGVRFELPQGLIVYNAARQTKWEYLPEQKLVRETPYRDPIMLDTMLHRARIENNFEVFRLLRPESLRDFELRRWTADDGSALQRISATDEHGRAISVELDLTHQRLLRTESCTHPGAEPVVRAVITYEYPDSLQLDVQLFERPAADRSDVSTEIAPPDSAARTQCMVNVRNLCMAVFVYAQQHEDRLPAAIEELAPYAPEGGLDAVVHLALPGGGTATIRYVGASLTAKTTAELTPAMVLFECPIGEVVVRGFGDGHVEAVPTGG